MLINSLPSDVTWFSSTQVGAPQMAGNSNGDMLKVLDACLISGLSPKTVQSITIDSNDITLYFGLGHGFLERQIISVTGANDSLLNGNHRITKMTNNTVTLRVVGATNTGGTIVAKVAPLGWESIFGSTNPLKRAYRSQSTGSSKRVIYLDMSYPDAAGYHASSPAKRAAVSICRDMTVLGEQIESITDAINNFAVNPNGSLFWYQKRGITKVTAVTSTPSRWTVIGNKDFFYFILAPSSNTGFDSTDISEVFGFGEYAGLGDESQEKTFLMAVDLPNDNGDFLGETAAVFSADKTTNPYVFSQNQGGFSKNYISVLTLPTGSFELVTGVSSMVYPNQEGSTLFTCPLRVGRSPDAVRGVMPAFLFIENNVAANGGAFHGKINDDVLMILVSKIRKGAYSPAYYAFYLGD